MKEFVKGTNQILFDIQDLNVGLYIVSYNASGKRVYGKFVKS